MTQTPSPTLRTRSLFGAFLLTAAIGLSSASSVREPDAYLVKRSSSQSSAASRSSTPRVRKTPAKMRVAPKNVVKPRSRRKDGTGALLRGAATESSSSRTAIKAGCGDRLVTGAEKCDDGNAVSGDGCSSQCAIETGYACDSGQPSTCWSRCGDGVVASNEKCDDGNMTGGDGCNASCRIEISYKCSGSPSVCAVQPYCGNGTKESGEECDDGNSTDYDGCDSYCKIKL